MTSEERLGVLIDVLAHAAFEAYSLDGCDAQDVLEAAGLLEKRVATAEDIANNSRLAEFDIEPGDDYYALTDFAITCRKLALEKTK